MEWPRLPGTVVLVTDDLRQYHRLAPFLTSRGIHLVGVRPDEPVPPEARVVLGAGDRGLPFLEPLDALYVAIRARLDPRPSVHPRPRHVVVGVDPGQRFGLALLVEEELYSVAEADSPAAAWRHIHGWQRALPGTRIVVHVGDQAPEAGLAFWDTAPYGMPTLWVREADSTPSKVTTLSRHTDAALRIARRPGRLHRTP